MHAPALEGGHWVVVPYAFLGDVSRQRPLVVLDKGLRLRDSQQPIQRTIWGFQNRGLRS